MLSALRRSIQSKPSFQEIQANVFAGLTVGVIALPLSMALAIASGVAPQHGLYTAIVAGIVIALTGGSKVNISAIRYWRPVVERLHGRFHSRFAGRWEGREIN